MNWLFCLAAWSLVAIVGRSIWVFVKDVAKSAKQLHQIPCANCQFFTNSAFLKCPVHPSRALTQEAIHCPDYDASNRFAQTLH